MQIEIIFDVVASPNLAEANRGVTCAFLLSARRRDGSVISAYRPNPYPQVCRGASVQ